MVQFQLLKKIDFFSQPFRFFVEEKSLQKQTVFGGVLSVFTIIVSLTYLIYLLFLFFDNQFLPTMSSYMKNQTTQVNHVFEKSLFGFTYYTNNKTVDQLQHQTGKVFLQFKLQKLIYEYNQIEEYDLNFVDCENDSNFIGFKCIDYNGISDSVKEIFSNPTSLSQSLFSLTVLPCTGLPNCATNDEISAYIMQNSFQFVVKVRVSQFNDQIRQMEETFLIDYIQFDDSLSLQNQYITSGILFQESNATIDVVSYKRLTTYYTQENMLNKAGFVGYGQFQFFLDQMQAVSKIQYPLITQVLAQFLPVLNILLTIGFLGKFFSKSKIVEDINNIYLKDYYKNTAIKIIQNQNKEVLVNVQQYSQTELIKQLHNNINDVHNFHQKEEKQKVSFKQKCKETFSKMFRKGKDQQKNSLYKLIKSKSIKNINIYQLYKDIIQLKMAIRLLMSPDQYAAMQFCGCEMNFKKIQHALTGQSDQNKYKINLQGSILKKEIDLEKKEEIIENQSKKNNEAQNQDLEDQINKQIMSILDCQESKAQVIKTSRNAHTIFSKHNFKSNNEDTFKEEDVLSQIQLCQIQKSDQIQQTSSPKVQILPPNHLQTVEDMISDKDNLFVYLKNFIDRVNDPKQKLSQTDINIYSSLIGMNYCPQMPQQQQQLQYHFPV